MSKLRNRMIRDMQFAGLADLTQREDLRAVRQLSATTSLRPIASLSGTSTPPCLHIACTDLALRELVASWHGLAADVRGKGCENGARAGGNLARWRVDDGDVRSSRRGIVVGRVLREPAGYEIARVASSR